MNGPRSEPQGRVQAAQPTELRFHARARVNNYDGSLPGQSCQLLATCIAVQSAGTAAHHAPRPPAIGTTAAGPDRLVAGQVREAPPADRWVAGGTFSS